jgi:anti-repressor protein
LSTIIPQSSSGSSNVFDVLGNSIRFGVTEDGRAYSVATDYAKAMGYRDAEKATRLLESDEKGTQIVGTPGGSQRMNVIYEDGMWELIFRSSLPGAKAIKKRVKAILQEIRRTGRYEVAPQLPQDYEGALVALLGQVRETKALSARVAELEPDAFAWERLASANGDFSVRVAANILNRDPSIATGQNRLFGTIRSLRMVDKRDIPYAAYNAHLRLKPGAEYEHPHTGEKTVGDPQVRVTIRGLQYLHKKLGGTVAIAHHVQAEMAFESQAGAA